MTLQELLDKIEKDLYLMDMPVDEVEITLRPYSKTYYGRYYTDGRLYLYPFKDKKGGYLPYSQIILTAIHEMCHHIQHSDPRFVRYKGIMHNADFWCMYHYYVNLAEDLGILERKEDDRCQSLKEPLIC